MSDRAPMKFLAALALLVLAFGTQAQSFPTKRVTFVSGVTPGAASDTMARLLAEKLQQRWGQPVIVENRLGAGGMIAHRYVADAPPDGYVVVMSASAWTITPLLHPNSVKPEELRPAAMVATIPTVLVAQPGKHQSIGEFVTAARASPGRIVCADAGIGSATHIALERFRLVAGIEVLNVHTKGPSEALTEVLSGRADCYFALVFQAKKLVDGGKVVALATSAPKRSSLMPEVPTTEELGFPNSHTNLWVGALVAAKTPRPIVEKLHDDITALVESPEMIGEIRKLGGEPLPMTLRQFEDQVAREFKENAELIRKANIRLN